MADGMSGRRWGVRLVWAFALVVGGAGFAYRRSTRTLPVAVDHAVRGKAVDAIYATGTVEAENRVHVKARTPGALVELLVRAGASVKQGDLLARIDSKVAGFDAERGRAELRAAVQQSGKEAPRLVALAAQAESIRFELATARTDLGRSLSLAASGAIPSSEVDRVRTKVSLLEGSLAANAAEQRALRVDLDAMRAQKTAQAEALDARVSDAEVRAPLDGIVLSKNVELGEVVSVNQALFTVGDARSLVLELDVDESDIARVRDGQGDGPGTEAAVSLLAFPHETLLGRVFEIMPDADRQKKAFLVKVRMEKPPAGLRSGMTAEVNLIVDAHEGLLVPSAAESGGSVWVVKGGRASQRRVRTGIRDPLRVEVLDGLVEGDELVVEGFEALVEGARVTATPKPLAKEAPVPESAVRARGVL
jgi:HlyD family secretion protein